MLFICLVTLWVLIYHLGRLPIIFGECGEKLIWMTFLWVKMDFKDCGLRPKSDEEPAVLKAKENLEKENQKVNEIEDVLSNFR